LNLSLFKEKKAENLLNGIVESKRRTLSRFLYAMGIPLAGEKACKVLAERFQTLENIMNTGEEKFLEIEGIGSKMAQSIKNFFSMPVIKEAIKQLRQLGVELQEEKETKTDKLQGKVFVFTGENPGSKYEKAKKLKIKILTYEEFMRLLEK